MGRSWSDGQGLWLGVQVVESTSNRQEKAGKETTGCRDSQRRMFREDTVAESVIDTQGQGQPG